MLPKLFLTIGFPRLGSERNIYGWLGPKVVLEHVYKHGMNIMKNQVLESQ
jgi:hypothetical protein